VQYALVEKTCRSRGYQMGQDDTSALALAHQCHAVWVTTKGSNVPLHPLKQRLLVCESHVFRDTGPPLSVDPTKNAQAEVKIDEYRWISGGLDDEVAVTDLFVTRPMLVHAAVEIDNHRHAAVQSLRQPNC